MTEPTPPPERPLSDDARARIRADLLGYAHDHRSTAPRWLVPAGAAAAVALVAGMAYWAVSPGDQDGAGGPAGQGSGASFTPETDRPSPMPSDDGSVPPNGTVPSGESTAPVSAPPESSQSGAGNCAVGLENVLQGADEAFVFPPGSDGTSAIYVKGEEFSLCDAREGITTVTHPLPLVPTDDVAPYRVLSLYPATSDGYQTIQVAAGIVPSGLEGVFDVSYTFPDGHTQQATTSTDDQGRTWWRMVYRYDDGGGNVMQKPPIEVTVSYSGVQKHYTLEWGVDTCAQANHGC
jgi:hypothetical protein